MYLVNGVELKSDGRWLEQGVYSVKDLEVLIGMELPKYRRAFSYDLWRDIPDLEWRTKTMMPTLGISEQAIAESAMRDHMAPIYAELVAQGKFDEMPERYRPTKEKKSFEWKLAGLLGDDRVCGAVADVCAFMYNIYCMSGRLTPFTSFVTPQCGEHHYHQWYLDRFAEINREIVKRLTDGELDGTEE